MQGPFKAITICEKNIDPEAWRCKKKRGFPYQVRVQSFAYAKPLSLSEIYKILDFKKYPPAIIDEETASKLLQIFRAKNEQKIIGTIDSEISSHWIFKCDKTTGGRVFTENIVGAPTSLFTEYVNKVQKGDTIFVWQIEERKLFGIWKATKRGCYDEFAFPEAEGKFHAIVSCERTYNLDKGLDEPTLQKLNVSFGTNNMPSYSVNLCVGKQIEEELFRVNQSTIPDYETHIYPRKFLTEDGHWVRSQGETIIDNWLYRNGLIHAYEHRIQRGKVFKKSDFYLPYHDLVIEYWGLSGNEKYETSKRDKINFYKSNNIRFLELFPQDIYMISEVLKSKLSNYGIDTK